jgi:putative membrane protein
MVTGIIIIIASIPAGLASIQIDLNTIDPNLFGIITNQLLVGQFMAGALPFLWIGIGSVFGGILLSNWLKGSLKAITDVLRIVVLVSLYPTIFQFTNILTFEHSPFTLIPPLLAGFAVTLISATYLFRRYRKKKGGEVLSE